MKKDKTILYVGLGLAALLALRYFSKKRTQAQGTPGRPMTPEESAEFKRKLENPTDVYSRLTIYDVAK